jgi:hypothetical protein
MKTFIIIGAVLLVVVAVAGFWLKRKVSAMAHGAKIIIIMQRLGQFSADRKKQGSFTNDIPHFCDIYPFTDSITLNGTQRSCTLAAKSPLFGDGGIMAITTDDTVVWIDRDGKATAFSGPDSVSP